MDVRAKTMSCAAFHRWTAFSAAAALSTAACVVSPAEEASARSRAAARAAAAEADFGDAEPASDDCENARAGYDSYVAQHMAELGATACMDDGDCRVVMIDNACNHGCGVAVAARIATTLKQDLDDYATTHCSACTAGGDACPPLERLAFCTGGACSAH